MKRIGVLFYLILIGNQSFAIDTEINWYNPFEAIKNLPIVKQLTGNCYRQSNKLKREDAWICTAQNHHYDPCFFDSLNPNQALCIKHPKALKAITIALKKPLDNQKHEKLDVSKAWPWAIELAQGAYCYRYLNPQSQTLDYRCSDSSHLVGEMMRCSPEWAVWQAYASSMTRASITKAWF